MRTAIVAALVAISAFARLIDGIAAVVNDSPITIYEIQKTSRALRVPPKEALELLIQKRLEEEQIRKLGIEVDDFELDEALERFAQSKGMSLPDLRRQIESRGIPWQEYKKSFKEQLLRKKLYQKIAQSHQSRPTREQLHEYYQNHLEEFVLAKRARLYKYVSPSKEILEKIRQNPMYKPKNPALLATGEEEVNLEEIEPTVAAIINKTPEGGFTPILPLPNDHRYLLILVKSKEEKITIPFEKAQHFILNKLMGKTSQQSVKEYFNRLRASANVKILRMP